MDKKAVSIEADDLVPLVLHFAKEYLDKKDYKKLCKNFNGNEDLDLENDKFVKSTGGIKGLLESFLENDEDAAEKLLGVKKDDKKKKKREEKADKKDKEKKVKRANGVMTRSRTQSLEWTPADVEVKPDAPVKEYKFQRIDEEKYKGLQSHEADYSYEAKARFGQTGDTYGDWSNSRLKDKVGKGFTKEKNKMKNKNFHASGGRFNAGAVNSVLM